MQSVVEINQSERDEYCRLELSPDEVSILIKYLPLCYSLQVDSKPAKRTNARAPKDPSLEFKTKKSASVWADTDPDMPSLNKPNRSSKYSSKFGYQEESDKYNHLQKDTSKKGNFQGIAEAVKPCIRILNLLKNSRFSWPFKEPVDPTALNIPHYFTIVKQPMDLSTVERNLKSSEYITPTQFHADINKIIKNSYLFNENDAGFMQATKQFEDYYHKITAEPVFEKTTSSYSDTYDRGFQKKKKSEAPPNDHQQVITIAERKELGTNIKRLPKEHMKGILEIVNQRKDKISGEFDLKELEPLIIRKLQNYVREKLSAEKVKERSAVEYNGMDEKQSPFELENQDDS